MVYIELPAAKDQPMINDFGTELSGFELPNTCTDGTTATPKTSLDMCFSNKPLVEQTLYTFSEGAAMACLSPPMPVCSWPLSLASDSSFGAPTISECCGMP